MVDAIYISSGKQNMSINNFEIRTVFQLIFIIIFKLLEQNLASEKNCNQITNISTT